MNLVKLYEKNHSVQQRDATAIISEFKDQLTWGENEKILDVGCGPGNTTANLIFPILPKSAHLLGIDVSEEMIDFAEKTFGKDRLRFKTMDISADNLTDIMGTDMFDKVFSFYCLHWVQKQRQSVINLWKLLKPNGYALLLFLCNTPIHDLYKLLSERPAWKDYMKDVDNFITPYQYEKNPSEIYKNLLESVGFNVMKCDEKVVPFDGASREILKQSLRAVDPFIERIPPDLQNEYLESLMNPNQDEQFMNKQVKINEAGNAEVAAITPNKIIIAFCQKRIC